MYDEALSHGVDVVVRGEGEYTTLELVNTLERVGMDRDALKEVKGIVFTDRNGEVVKTRDRPIIRNLMSYHSQHATYYPWISTRYSVSQLG